MTTYSNFARRALRGGTALQALALLGAGIGAAGLLATPASAQDFTTGSLLGTVTNADGSRATSGTVTVRSNAQGFTRTLPIGSDGSFRISALPVGSYNVSVESPNGTSSNDIAISAGYADGSVFSRAFRTWTGGAPSRSPLRRTRG